MHSRRQATIPCSASCRRRSRPTRGAAVGARYKASPIEPLHARPSGSKPERGSRRPAPPRAREGNPPENRPAVANRYVVIQDNHGSQAVPGGGGVSAPFPLGPLAAIKHTTHTPEKPSGYSLAKLCKELHKRAGERGAVAERRWVLAGGCSLCGGAVPAGRPIIKREETCRATSVQKDRDRQAPCPPTGRTRKPSPCWYRRSVSCRGSAKSRCSSSRVPARQ